MPQIKMINSKEADKTFTKKDVETLQILKMEVSILTKNSAHYDENENKACRKMLKKTQQGNKLLCMDKVLSCLAECVRL